MSCRSTPAAEPIQDRKAEGPQYWRSLDELAQTPEFEAYLHREFPQNASEWLNSSRRDFLKVMAASFALAGVTGCGIQQPQEEIVPYIHSPPQLTPGLPLYFATAADIAGVVLGLIVQSRAGRPIKIEGNPNHPNSGGATTVFAQAATLDLYDPDRMQVIQKGNNVITKPIFLQYLLALRERHNVDSGSGLRILATTSSSPTRRRLQERLLKQWPQAKWVTYDAVSQKNIASGNGLVFDGQDELSQDELKCVPIFANAKVVLSIDHDFLSARNMPPAWITDFAQHRRVAGRKSQTNASAANADDLIRLYHIGAVPTLTAAKADHRLTISPNLIFQSVLKLAQLCSVDIDTGLNGTSSLGETQIAWLSKTADDLKAAGASALLLVGLEQPAVVHALVHTINSKLGAVGNSCLYYAQASVDSQHKDSVVGLPQLVKDVKLNQVETLLILDGNPVYNAPGDFNFGSVLKNISDTLHLSSHINETGELCKWKVPQSHFLEAWGDCQTVAGVAAITQPLIDPLYDSITDVELLANLLGSQADANADPTAADLSAYSQVRLTWKNDAQSDAEFDSQWQTWLRDGIITTDDAKAAAITPELKDFEAINVAVKAQREAPNSGDSEQSFEVLFRPDPTVWDGRYANNGWLQELPKPLTRLTWDNAALCSPSDFESLGLKTGELVELQSGNNKVKVAVWPTPGQAKGTLTLFSGYGRKTAGRVGSNIGFDISPLRNSTAMDSLAGVKLFATSDKYQLATTQHHQMMDGRSIVRSGTVEALQQKPERPEFAHPKTKLPIATLYPEFPPGEYKWGMTIDLTACVGCSACVIACQAENNIPVVGKTEVTRNREMHWIRVDTYYSGESDEPATIHQQPVPCMHCENAPCEVVCPVAATNHSDDGLNQMIYNRCVGTRYCSNNCPYKVRRFNFLDYSDSFVDKPSLTLLSNPEVTLRSRGVMEKCTYCIQRISNTKINAQLEDRRIQDGEVQTACQSVCPAQAIQFGDLADTNSQVSAMHKDPLNYTLLEELNAHPRTTYLAEVRNPNSEI